jgi:hypothetical protein
MLAVVSAGTLGGVSLYAGLAYEPPRLSMERVAGAWSDGKGGMLILTADGKATATGIETFDTDDSFERVVHKCTGTGSWTYDPGAGPWSQQVDVSVEDCSMDSWEVFGTPEHPKLFVYIGDPDNWDLYILQRSRPGHPSAEDPATALAAGCTPLRGTEAEDARRWPAWSSLKPVSAKAPGVSPQEADSVQGAGSGG